MIEKKFRDLLIAYFSGEIEHADLNWMAEDLRKRRERRDLFIERTEDFLENEAGPARRESDKRLRSLLLKDLSKIDVRELEVAMPRARSGTGGANSENVDDEAPVDYSTSRRASVQGSEIRYDEPSSRGKDSSLVMPVVGVGIIVVTFFLMIRFSSIKEDKMRAEEEAKKEQEELMSDEAALRGASEFISEHFRELAPDEEEAGNAESPSTLGERPPPVSLVELIGERSEPEAEPVTPAMTEGGGVILNKPSGE